MKVTKYYCDKCSAEIHTEDSPRYGFDVQYVGGGRHHAELCVSCTQEVRGKVAKWLGKDE